jgi:hypothetical protein
MTRLRIIRSISTTALLSLALGTGLAYADSNTTSPTVSTSSSSNTVVSSDSTTTTTTVSNNQVQVSPDASQVNDSQSASGSQGSSQLSPDQNSVQPQDLSISSSKDTTSQSSSTPGQQASYQPVSKQGASKAPDLNQWVRSFDSYNLANQSTSGRPQISAPVVSQTQGPVAPAEPQPALPQDNPAAILQQLSLLLAGSVTSVLMGFGGLSQAGLAPTAPVLPVISLTVLLLAFSSLFLKFSKLEAFARAPRGSTITARAYNLFATPLKMSLTPLGVP